MDIYTTLYMMMLVRGMRPLRSFLRDRYFPSSPDDIFTTSKVLVEYYDGDEKIAPFVAPRKGSVTMLRSGSYLKTLEPPNVAPDRVLTLDDAQKRDIGEALFGQYTAEERAEMILLRDLADLHNMIVRREEQMAAETMLTNGCVMKHIADDAQEGDDMEVRYYEEDANPASYTPAIAWNQAGAAIMDDMDIMAGMLTSEGKDATELLVDPTVAQTMLKDKTILEMLDKRNVHLGSIDPKTLPAGASVVAELNINGRMISVIRYDATYLDGKVRKPYLPAGTAVMTAPAAGKRAYGAVNQIEVPGGALVTRPGTYVPKFVSNLDNNTRKVVLTSKPLLMPKQKNPWISGKVL